MKAEVENGTLKINITDLIDQIDEDSRQEIIEAFAWQSAIWYEIQDAVCSEYAAENYNDQIYRLRLAFLQSEDAPELIRYTIKSLLATIKHLRQRDCAIAKADGEWRTWFCAHHPNTRIPVAFPRNDLGWVDSEELGEFLKRNGLMPEVSND